MEKEENFIVMGIMLGVLLLVVVILGAAIRHTAASGDNATSTDTVITDDDYIEEDDTPVYEKLDFELDDGYITSDFTVEVIDDSGTITNELLYTSNYKNYYLYDMSSTFTYVTIGGRSLPVKDALNSNLISIHDLKDKLGESVIEEERYELSYGRLQTLDNGKMHYNNAKELIISLDGNASNVDKYSRSELISLLKYKTAVGEVKTYSINNTSSYMFELKYERLFACSDGNIYITSKAIDLDCK